MLRIIGVFEPLLMFFFFLLSSLLCHAIVFATLLRTTVTFMNVFPCILFCLIFLLFSHATCIYTYIFEEKKATSIFMNGESFLIGISFFSHSKYSKNLSFVNLDIRWDGFLLTASIRRQKQNRSLPSISASAFFPLFCLSLYSVALQQIVINMLCCGGGGDDSVASVEKTKWQIVTSLRYVCTTQFISLQFLIDIVHVFFSLHFNYTRLLDLWRSVTQIRQN